MGWNMLFMLHLICAMAAMVGVHSENDPTAVLTPQYQAFEGDAVHSMMRSWVEAGTNRDLFSSSRWDWSFEEHPCNRSRSGDSNAGHWYGISCSTMPEDSNLVQNRSLVGLELDNDDSASMLQLVGELPPELVNLTNLRTLSISNIRTLFGPLPAGLFCSSQVLRYMKLSGCSFNGSISSGFDSDCHQNYGLEYLDLSRNSFTEMSPISSNIDTYIDKYYSNLQYLNVSNNQIKGEFAIWTNFLEVVDISNNFIMNITALGETSRLSLSLKSIYAQNNVINRFPTEIFEYKSLQDIYLDSNNISSLPQNISNTNVSTIQKISMSKNKFQLFPEQLLQLPNLKEIILDSNNISGELYLPNISCQHSKIKLISLLYNNITHFYPSNDDRSYFSELGIMVDAKVFLYGNPICKDQSPKTKLLQFVCRINATFPIEVEEHTIVTKILLITVPCISSIVVVSFITGFFVIRRLKKKISLLREIQSEFDKRDVKPNLYSFSELKVATEDFHIRNELGRGGFGIVYKGVFPDGSHVAVKKLTKLSMEQGIQDFLSEIIVVSNIKHRNLVQLKGCCIRENQRILVHEFVENKNLKDALWGDSRSGKHLDWPTRFNIILGIARGLVYLHEDVQPSIVHRDIKGENILLDKNYNPKIADFGLALFFPSLDDGETHMSVSTIAGTKGYMAPEYLCYGQVSTKLDVFSFGVLLLEIVSGRKKIDLKSPNTEQYLVLWAQELHSNDNLSNLKDKSLEEMTMVEEATFKQVVKVGLQCLHHIAARRPTMSEVVAMLIGNKNVDACTLEDYHEGSSSSFGVGSSSFCFSTPKSSLQDITKDDNNLHLNSESHKQSLQLCEIGLLSK